MFEELTDRLNKAFRTITGRARITEANIKDAVKEVRRALLAADVHYKVAKEFTERVKQRALGQEVIKNVSPGNQFVKIVYDELVNLLGSTAEPLNLKRKPAIILLTGLQGSGKTTFAAKLAKFIKNSLNKTVLLVAADVHRPAATEQLKTLGEKVQVPVFAIDGETNAVKVVEEGIKYGKQHGFDVIIIDTAGRQSVQEELMKELEDINKSAKPDEVLYVLDAMMGQDAVNIAKQFYERVPFTGVVISKMDADARGGAALTVNYITGKPIKFVSNGEHIDDIEIFYPDRYARRILGMGDVISLVEKLQQQIDEEKAKKLEKKLRKNQFDFNDMLDQLRQIRKMGNLKGMLSLIPGLGSKLKDIDIDERRIKHLEAIILSMTPEERSKPEIINESRKRRIAKGSGRPIEEVNNLLKQYKQMKKMIKHANRIAHLMKMNRRIH